MPLLAYLAVAFLPGVLSQIVDNAICSVTALAWTYNSLDQSPCDVAAHLAGVCNGGAFTLDPLEPDFVYLGPSKLVANSCRCSTVYYSMLSACAACQGNSWIGWTQYSFNCTTVYNQQFPQAIPAGINVPAWAYSDIAASNNFSLSIAQSLDNQPDSSALPSATSALPFPTGLSSGVFTTGGVPTITAGATNSGSHPSSSGTSHAGAIAGGVIGGVVFVALVAGLAFFFLRRNRNTQPPSSAFATTAYTPAPYNPEPTPNMGYAPNATTAYTPSHTEPQSQRLYDPSDPSTFPTTPAPVPSSPYSTTYTPPPPSAQYNPFQGSSPHVAQPQMPSAAPAPGHYTGAPELG